MKITAKEFETHPVGSYNAVFKSVEEVEGEFGNQFLFKLESELKNNDGAGYTVFHYTSQTLSPKSKLGKMVKDIFGTDIKKGTEFDTDIFIGELVQCVITHNESGRAVVSAWLPKRKGKLTSNDPFADE